MGDAVGAGIGLRVGQTLVAVLDGDGVRPLPHLLLEELEQAVVVGVGLGGVVPLGQQTVALRGRDDVDVERPGAGPVVVGQRGNDPEQRGFHVPQYRVRREGGVDLCVQGEFGPGVVDRHTDRVVGAVQGSQPADAQVLQGGRAPVALTGLEVPVVDHRTEQGGVAVQTAGLLGQGECALLVGDQFLQAGVDVGHQLLDAAVAQPYPQGQGVDEVAQHPLDAGDALEAPGQDGAEHHVVAPAGGRGHQGPRGVEEAGGADAQAPGLLAQVACQSGRERAAQVATRLPSPCTSTSWNGVVGSVTSPSS